MPFPRAFLLVALVGLLVAVKVSLHADHVPVAAVERGEGWAGGAGQHLYLLRQRLGGRCWAAPVPAAAAAPCTRWSCVMCQDQV